MEDSVDPCTSSSGSVEPRLIAAPMVRYSKLPFRKLVRKYRADLAFTPMIIASSFAESEKARQAEFSTDYDDRPLVVQFAACNALDMWRATEYIVPYSDGVDLNCGCPQKWAMQEGYGSKLIYQPELVRDIVQLTRRNISNPSFSVSVKIRLCEDQRKTVDLCRTAEAAGISFLTVHARTPKQRSEPVCEESLKLVKTSLNIPVYANGDVKSLKDAKRICQNTGTDGVMVARGLLHNPALFFGYDATPIDCVQDWLNLSLEHGTLFTTFHHHLMFMLDRHLTKAEKRVFNRLQSVPAVIDYLSDRFNI